jgi:hypothetical protein
MACEPRLPWRVDKKFEDYVEINEYDGNESVAIDFKRYKLDQIQLVVESKEPDEWKFMRIREILGEDEPVVTF